MRIMPTPASLYFQEDMKELEKKVLGLVVTGMVTYYKENGVPSNQIIIPKSILNNDGRVATFEPTKSGFILHYYFANGRKYKEIPIVNYTIHGTVMKAAMTIQGKEFRLYEQWREGKKVSEKQYDFDFSAGSRDWR